ncbi:MAG: hypothetical protein KAR13_00065 [Desulfobulbaceae bacterium]|nr:hypothetical protein [Desulfobulbaceae bacterium]
MSKLFISTPVTLTGFSRQKTILACNVVEGLRRPLNTKIRRSDGHDSLEVV